MKKERGEERDRVERESYKERAEKRRERGRKREERVDERECREVKRGREWREREA
jgi:hypothetical protein